VLGVGEFVAVAWRVNTHAVAHVEVIPANYGTAGSRAGTRRRRTDVIISPPDPRLPLYNGMLPVQWRRRVVDTAKVAAVQARAPQTIGLPVNFATPRVASLSTGRLPA
jgi:hypothetical protein